MAVDGIFLQVFEHVVHPAHVPFQIEAQTAKVGGARDLRPGSGFFGEGQRFRVLQM